jgi:hypothetical protein
MKDDFDVKINRDLDKFLDVCSIQEMFDIVIEMVPLVELNEMMAAYEKIENENERQEMSALLFSRVIYLLSKFSSKYAGKLCVIKSVFPDLHKRMEDLNPNGQ